MQRKNLIILLIMPFIIALIGVVSINLTFDTFYKDVEISWDFGDMEGVMYTEKLELNAQTDVSDKKNVAPGNELIYSVENKDKTIVDPIAEVIYENGKYYLKANSKGEVILTVSNEKGNKWKKTTVVFYENGAILLTPKIESSQNNIDSTIYYGLYDYDSAYDKVKAKIEFNLQIFPNELIDNINIESSANISASINDNSLVVSVNSVGDSYISLLPTSSYEIDNDATYKFSVVDGVNVYNYNELLQSTNKSSQGEVVCLRKNFVSLDTYNKSTKNNDELFGNYNENTKKFNFANEVYTYKTTYNNEFIREWNEFVKLNSQYQSLKDDLVCGLHIQKDFYGNGYTINMHNLTYPSLITNQDGVAIPTLSASDLFRGPLPFYCLGDPNGMPLVVAYGQDNAGIYIDDDNVMINDLNVLNCSAPGSLSFMDTVGNVIDICANNVTIKNSRVQNGKNVIRAFSSKNLTIDNSLLSNAYNFLIVTGSNEYEKNDSRLKTFFEENGQYNETLNQYLIGNFTDKSSMQQTLNKIQSELNQENLLDKNNLYHGTMTINNTYFYQAGLSCICFESLFNGPYLFTGSPTFINEAFSLVNDKFAMEEGKKIIPFTPSDVSGMSYPVSINVTGDTRFYDYKDVSKIDLNGLIKQNISAFGQMAGKDVDVSIDAIFPLKQTLVQKAKEQGCITTDDEINYINIPVCYYGGGLNLSKITFESELNKKVKTLNVDFAANYLNLPGLALNPNSSIGIDTSNLSGILSVAKKCVVVTTGFEPFKFSLITNDDYLYSQSPNAADLIDRA